MLPYFLLAVGIACALAALICLIISAGHWIDSNEAEQPNLPQGTGTRVMLISGTLFIVFASAAYKIYSHLQADHREVLQYFGVWYAIGFVSYLILLTIKGLILNPPFETDWEEVWFALFVAIAGPLVTVHACWRIFIKKEKNNLH